MSHTLSIYTSGKQRKKRYKKKMAMTGSVSVKAPNVAKRMASENASEVSITFVEAQRQNRQATQKWKAKARKFAFGLAISLHAAALVIFGIWFIKKAVLQMNVDNLQSVIVKAPKPQTKRIIQPRKTQKTAKPKVVKVLAPKTNGITTNTNVSVGPADFTIPMTELPADNTMRLTALERGKGMMEQTRQVKIVSTAPKFEMPKFETTGLTMQMDMGTSLATVDFEDSADLSLSAAGFGDTKQSFSEFLKRVRERIKEMQRFPPNVRNLEEGSSATIRFTLLRDGTIRDPKVASSSGSHVLDNAALAAVQNAEPYPPFPEAQSGNSIRLELPVVFELVN
ncbi:energy transducer TonB [Candidatus Poribacteria bacterium]|nr:energy transducer TonB [Candidatus Poribacteria bacterium]